MARLVPKKIRDKWVEALLSGKYKQTTDQLRDENGFCCLGVLCDISGVGHWNTDTYVIPMEELGMKDATSEDIIEEYSEVPTELRDYLKIKQGFSNGGFIPKEHRRKIIDRINKNHKDEPDWKPVEATWLTNLNDNGATFADIAWVIKTFM